MCTFDEFKRHPDVTTVKLEYSKYQKSLVDYARQLDILFNEFDQNYQTTKFRRAFISKDVRVKQVDRVLEKMWDELKREDIGNIKYGDIVGAFRNVHDVLGGRIEVRFFDEVETRVAELKQFFRDKGFTINLQGVGIQDKNFLENDNNGYRAYHLFVQGSMGTPNVVGVSAGLLHSNEALFEVQIRSSFQHVWAVLIHPMVYEKYRNTSRGVPRVVRESMKGLSASIYAADMQLMALRRIANSKI